MADADDTHPRYGSAPAAQGAGRIKPGLEVGTDLASERTRLAVRVEQRQAVRLGLLMVGAVVFLAALALLADHLLTGRVDPRPEDAEAWARGLLSIGLLTVSAQLVAVLLALEHLVGRRDQPGHWLRLSLVWAGRFVVALGVVLSVLVNWPGPDDAPAWWTRLGEWDHAGVALLVAEAFALGCLLLLWQRIRGYDPAPRMLHADASSAAAYELVAPADDDGVPPLRAIGASGGGIRATAFVLGGHQAVQDRARRRADDGTTEEEPHVFAVSGGSYAAAALALRRSFNHDGSPRAEPTDWTESYRLDSPEVERLRRHTRYLFEPRWRTQDGLVSLLMGAAVNLLIVGLLLRLITWVSAEFALITGVVELTRDDAGRALELDIAPGWSLGDWLLLVSFSLGCALAIALLTLVSWWATSVFDSGEDGSIAVAHPKAMRLMDWSSRLRPALFLGGVGWLVLVLGLPATSVGLVHLTTSNQPNTTVATVLNGVGFGSRSLCVHAVVDQLRGAVERAGDEARISPDQPREVTAGACGVETTVSRTVASQGTPEVADDIVLPANDVAAGALARTHGIPGQVAGLTALLLFVLGLLRRGPSPQSSVDARWRTRARRVLMTWLPLGIMLVVVGYLALLWTLRFVLYLNPGYAMVAAGLTAAACAVGYLLDANATSLHNFYRSRLSDAFAVAVDERNGRADELPPGIVYRYSDLASASSPDRDPHLHVIATLNSQAPNESPTMRGGFPLVFGPREVSLHREERQHICVPIRDYERFAGPGRVSIMASVAISGAAISPLMGRYSAQTAPYRLLLALFNVRVGTWVSNPMHAPTASHDIPLQSAPERRAKWTDLFWLTRKPGLAQVALEAVGNSSADRRWVYLSDGGHLDNTGLVEAVRFCVEERIGGRILVLDASNDPPGAWSAVGDAISVIRADLGIDLRRVDLTQQPPWLRVFQGSGLEVVVVKAVRVDSAPPGSDERDWSRVLPPDVISFQLTHQDFPRSSTSRQKFGDLEFEAYRSFGYAVTAESLRLADRARFTRGSGGR